MSETCYSLVTFVMKPRSGDVPRGTRDFQEGGVNWVFIAGGAVLSMLSARLGYKIKQVVDTKRVDNSGQGSIDGKSVDRNKRRSCNCRSNAFCFSQEDGFYNDYNGSRNVVELKQPCNDQIVTEPETVLPLATVPHSEFNKENSMMWSSSPDRLELAHKPFRHSNSSGSPCISESGSDIFNKREVIQKLRQQLKRRDDMILEMQDQMAELQNSIRAQISHSSCLQSTLAAANRDLIDSEMEIQRLRKAIADHCVGHIAEETNGHTNGSTEFESNLGSSDKRRRDGEKIEMLKSEINELKEMINGKDYLLESYREQKSELSMKIKELQQRLDSQLPNIL
ncbi:hypothetical protein ACS0TY_012459 [Phlomoides rotata]